MSLQEALAELSEELGVPGAVAGVVMGGDTETAAHGVTNIDHPLDVDEETLFQFGSTGKTYTASALMVLAEQGKVDLDATVRTYVPDLKLQDESVAEKVTVLQLLNHTAGWAGDIIKDTGDGDDCLDRYVADMVDIEQVSPLGDSVSYNNASLCLAGHVIARVTGTTYEQAIRDLLLEPLGMDRTYGFGKEIMTFRFASGHIKTESGELKVARPWALPRSGTPAGGWTATIGDQLKWARFHLGMTGDAVLSTQARQRMQQPTAHMPGSALGDAVGISWLLTDHDGTLVVSHGGSTHGQHSDFALVPEHNFAFACMTNSDPSGAEMHGRLRKWALEHYLGITETEPELATLSPDDLAAYVGTYVTSTARMTLLAENGRLVGTAKILDEAVRAEGQPDEIPDIPLALLAGDGDRYVIPDGMAKGMRGYFSRSASGEVDGLNFSGRHMTREPVGA